MERVEGLRRLNTKQEYEEAKVRLESYLKQYKWITETKTPYEDIKAALLKCVETRKSYEDKDGTESDAKGDVKDGTKDISNEELLEEREASRLIELENENKILALKLQYEAIKGDTYVGNLRRNITALYVTIGDYEARNFKNIDGMSDEKGKEKTTSGIAPLTSRSMRRFRFFLANLTGLVPGEINMDVENRKEIPLYILENYDLVNKPEITPEHKEMALVVVPEVDTSKGILHRLVERPVDQFIASRGIREKGVYEKTAQISEDGISAENKFAPKEQAKGQSQTKAKDLAQQDSNIEKNDDNKSKETHQDNDVKGEINQ